MQYHLEDFIEASNRCAKPEDVFLLFQIAIEKLGFNSAVYTFVNDHTSIGQKAGHGVQFSFPEHWMKYYLEKGYQNLDPVITQVVRSRQAFTWRDLIAQGDLSVSQTTMFNQASESGLVEGVGVPLHGINGEVAGLGLASHDGEVYGSKDMLSKVQLLSTQFHLVYCQLHSEAEVVIPVLTPRELEVLKWWALGKTMNEVALILGCSVDNIKFHVKQIYRKLEVNSKALAITRAVRLGLITLERIDLS